MLVPKTKKELDAEASLRMGANTAMILSQKIDELRRSYDKLKKETVEGQEGLLKAYKEQTQESELKLGDLKTQISFNGQTIKEQEDFLANDKQKFNQARIDFEVFKTTETTKIETENQRLKDKELKLESLIRDNENKSIKLSSLELELKNKIGSANLDSKSSRETTFNLSKEYLDFVIEKEQYTIFVEEKKNELSVKEEELVKLKEEVDSIRKENADKIIIIEDREQTLKRSYESLKHQYGPKIRQ